MRFVILALLALGKLATAFRIAVVLNNSPAPIYVWSVGGAVSTRYDVKTGGYKP